ncbi:MAG: 2-oxoacid:acceptor oxidoreductase family protein, partial [Thermoanaerobaculia bacterium]
MQNRTLTIAMVGAGGDGIVTMGDVLSQAAARDGLNVLKTEAYGPQIRGGESSCVVRLSADPIYESGDGV